MRKRTPHPGTHWSGTPASWRCSLPMSQEGQRRRRAWRRKPRCRQATRSEWRWPATCRREGTSRRSATHRGSHCPGSNTDGINCRKGAPVPMKDRRKRGSCHIEQDRHQQPAQLRINRQGGPGHYQDWLPCVGSLARTLPPNQPISAGRYPVKRVRHAVAEP